MTMGRRPLESGTRSVFRTFRVGPTLGRQLVQMAQERQTSISEIIREALEAYVAANHSQTPQPPQGGAADVVDLFEGMY